jgi:hypothetical protein
MRFHEVMCFSILSLGITASSVAYGQFQPASKDELSMTADPKAPGADAVYLQREEVSDDPHHFTTVYARVKVLTERGKEAATIHVSYVRNYVFHATGDNSSRMGSGTANHWDAPDVNHTGEDMPNDTDSFNVRTEISAIEARTIHPDGTIVPLTGSPSDLLKLRRGRNQANDISFTLPSVEVGSILEYRYQIRYDRFLRAPSWEIQQEYFTHRAHFSFTPAEKFLPERTKGGGPGVDNSALTDAHGDVMTDVRSSAVLPPNKSVKAEASGAYTLDLTDIPAYPNEAFGPPPQSLAYGVHFFYTPTPDVKEFWQKEMGYWMKELNQYISPTPSLKHTVDELCSGLTSPSDKAKKIYETVQKLDNTDFSYDGEPGIGSEWIPAGRVEKVLEDKKGTSNQLAYLYLALTRIAGLNSRPERIASRSRRIFAANLLSADQLDSVVIGLQIDGKELTVDPGTRMAPFETLHWAHAGAGGIALAGNGKVETIFTPLQKNTDNNVLHVGSVAFTSNGTISGTLKVAFIGQQAIYFRQMGIRSGPDAVKETVQQLITREVPQGVIAKVDHLVYLDDSSKQLLAIVPVSGQLTSNGGSRLILPRAFFETKETNPFPAEDDRALPIDVRYPSQEQEQITYELPSGYTVEGKPEDTVMKWEENAAYQLKSKVDATSITTARVLARAFTLLDAKEYGPLRDFYQKVVIADQQQVVLSAVQAKTSQ